LSLRPHRSGKISISVPVVELRQYGKDWLNDGLIRQHSKQTLFNRKGTLDRFFWFLEQQKVESCGTAELRSFLAYFNTGHETEGNRWGDKRIKAKAKPKTVHAYHGHLRAFC
jgi:hypothetical protein